MRPNHHWVLVPFALALGVFLLIQNRALAKPADEHKAEREAINSVLSAQQNAWNRGDVDAFLVEYWHSPELTFSGNSGVARGWDGVLARYKKNYPDKAAMGQLDFSELEFRFLGPDAALVLGRWHLKREKDEPEGVFTLVWQRFPEGWKIIHDHTSVVAPPNPQVNRLGAARRNWRAAQSTLLLINEFAALKDDLKDRNHPAD